jgi:hypothetical protein
MNPCVILEYWTSVRLIPRWSWAAMILAAGACSDSDLPPPRRICDGSTDYRMLYQEPIYMGFAPMGQHMVAENGQRVLVVRGDCHYWVLNLSAPTTDTREGTLSAEEETQLHDDLRYDEWPELAGVYGDGNAADMPPPTMLSDLKSHVGCYNLCDTGDPKLSPPVTLSTQIDRGWRCPEHGRCPGKTPPPHEA